MRKFVPIMVLVLITCTSQAQIYSKVTEKVVIQAIKNDKLKPVLIFIGDGNNIDGIYGREKMTLLNLAIKNGSVDIAKKLISMGADRNKESRGKTPLMFCIQHRQKELMRYLIKNGASINARTKKGNTALFEATKMNKLEYVKFLVESGADVVQVNDKKMTALDLANSADYPEIAEYLVKITEFRHHYNNLPAYSDGPYVDWENDSTIRMFYLNYDTIKRFPVLSDEFFSVKSDTTRINGFDSDSTSYLILRNHPPDPSIYRNVSKILAVGDFHGHYLALINFLIQNKVIDKNRNWIWGDGHLVFGGDVTDRGSDVTESLWFIYQLDLKAKKSGGRVHMLLGNHEIMVMTNDTRYLNDKYAFFLKYFLRDYASFYGPNTELGRWLRSQNVVIKINGFLFSHAGISPAVLNQHIKIDKINPIVRNFLIDQKMPKQDVETALILGINGPMWYRGYIFASEKSPLITQSEVDSILKFYDASKLIIAHTENGSIRPMFEDKVIAIDVPIQNKEIISEAMLYEKGDFYVAGNDGKKSKLF
jgi:predicted MPP superfamily phosphohydrolase